MEIRANRVWLADLDIWLSKCIFTLSLLVDGRVQAPVKVEVRLTVTYAKFDDSLNKHSDRERKYLDSH